jgi:hypothetical protein
MSFNNFKLIIQHSLTFFILFGNIYNVLKQLIKND